MRYRDQNGQDWADIIGDRPSVRVRAASVGDLGLERALSNGEHRVRELCGEAGVRP
jgi:hypothetical protein